jgi:hypothetical protein
VPRRRSTLSEISYVLRAYWFLALSLFLFIVMAGVAWLSSQRPMYEISGIVSDKQEMLSPNTGSGLGGLTGGLLNLKQENSGVKALQEMIYTPELAHAIEARHVSRLIFADRWDPVAKRWRRPRGAVYGVTSTLSGWFGVHNTPDITIEDLQTWLTDITFIESDVQHGTYKVAFFYPNREEGRHLLDLIIAEADQAARQQQLAQVVARRRYLDERLTTTQTPEQRLALVQLIERVEMRNVVGRADQYYLVDVLSRPEASIRIKRPRYTLTVALLILVGALITLSVVWTTATLRRRAIDGERMEAASPKDRGA